MKRLTVAISPCPNDTAIFGAWMLGLLPQAPKASFVFLDVENLNEAALSGRFDVIKVSAAVGVSLGGSCRILPSGAAFGLGVGPKLAVPAGADPADRARRVAVPGLLTTAARLLRAALADPEVAARPGMPVSDAAFLPVRYDRVAGTATETGCAALLIHETALAPERHGLKRILDLGQWWDRTTGGLPLPLGLIVGRENLGRDRLWAVARTIRESLEAALSRPEAVMPLIAAMAIEKDHGVVDAHIRAYVNELSRDMGETGRKALAALAGMGKTTPSPLPVLDESW
ncbi:MqnA/MqnD/SBP family protein [Desulfolutivibrio sulfoxidireducens]|uniref:MqnA/MqnD/SBP family protein n=1 Tax=Desulfolutivibrio sulfoxidireducens TaxID=2773299 RepID=UPI00159D6474|nr:MqnA/MqnD/SBP family protein [Desulfolutivibrio sulfoxidireducens]QLA17279.1 ABC transporter substrate-binding protein [Desulfolutivibrio sulfoxidireducens]